MALETSALAAASAGTSSYVYQVKTMAAYQSTAPSCIAISPFNGSSAEMYTAPGSSSALTLNLGQRQTVLVLVCLCDQGSGRIRVGREGLYLFLLRSYLALNHLSIYRLCILNPERFESLSYHSRTTHHRNAKTARRHFRLTNRYGDPHAHQYR